MTMPRHHLRSQAKGAMPEPETGSWRWVTPTSRAVLALARPALAQPTSCRCLQRCCAPWFQGSEHPLESPPPRSPASLRQQQLLDSLDTFGALDALTPAGPCHLSQHLPQKYPHRLPASLPVLCLPILSRPLPPHPHPPRFSASVSFCPSSSPLHLPRPVPVSAYPDPQRLQPLRRLHCGAKQRPREA